MKEEEIYTDCDRCDMSMQITGDGPERVINYVVYKNATLCSKCAKIRQFDDDNPIMYPSSQRT